MALSWGTLGGYSTSVHYVIDVSPAEVTISHSADPEDVVADWEPQKHTWRRRWHSPGFGRGRSRR